MNNILFLDGDRMASEDTLNYLVSSMRDAVWSAPLLLLIFITGTYLTIKLRALPLRYALFGLKQAFSKEKKEQVGDISHFQALMTSLASAIGTGSVVGVATAIETGGMGSIFWMWVTALIGMSLKYAESLLAVRFRSKDEKGEMRGGPMYYIERGLQWKKTAKLFALFGAIAAIGTGNMVQVNSIAATAEELLGINPWIVGSLVAFLTWFVLMRGVLSISRVASFLVPFMALFYFLASLYILLESGSKLSAAFFAIFHGAFNTQAAAGGFLGATVAQAIQVGVARSIFSSEAGLGVSSIAAAAAKTDMPARQGMVAMTGALLSTALICTMTALVIHVSGALDMPGLSGASLAIRAFESHLAFGHYILAIGLVLFAYTTIIGWAYYGEKCVEFLLGSRSIPLYRSLYCLLIIPGAALHLTTVWAFADMMNGLMAIPNLLALIALGRVISSETTSFIYQLKREKEEPPYTENAI